MTSPTATTNFAGDYEESILRLARHLGRDKHRRAIFALIYGRGSKPRSKKQIAEALGLDGDAQVIQNALEHLARHHLILKSPNEGKVRDGSRFVYAKEEPVRAHRAAILRYADDPDAAKKVATKRQLPAAALSFVKPAARAAASRRRARTQAPRARLRVALLVTNPDSRASLQTMVEARDIQLAVKSTERSGQIDVKVLPAPTFDTLLDMLNDYDPTIIHFSGHGGGRTLLFDNERAEDDGGTVLDFDMIARVIATTSAQPALLVLAACDTTEGADRFLSEIPAVIAMANSIDDEAAAEFSPRLYKSLASGVTIAKSLDQAKLLLEQKGHRHADLPTLLTRAEADGRRVLI